MTKIFFYLMFLLVAVSSIAQTDFGNYKTLQSKGVIPEDFTKSTKSKLDDDLAQKKTDLTASQEKILFEGTNYAIDELLHSGLVVYGDEISKYATEIVDRLLRNDPSLRSELRIYTIKSNETNAFSTDQGIIFVTTGLMSQITCEAQLAFVLAHEIAHYQKKHVLETFDWKLKNARHSDQIVKLSNYSKEKEFEADKGGLALYCAAGYGKDYVFETFDVLMYSYLPFDDIEFPFAYFNSTNMYVPTSLFPKKKYEIKAIEDYDDSNSSHPNIKKRKEAVEKEIDSYSNWETADQYLGQNRFETVRNIARFESVRTDLLDASFGSALYSVFLLERDFPTSAYLKRMKAQIWLNLMLYKKQNKSNKTIDNSSDLEGESAAVHFLLKKLTKDGMTTLALRQVYDLHKQYPEDEEISAVYAKFIKDLAEIKTFKIENYSKKKFSEAANDFLKDKTDTTVQLQDTVKSGSKYDRIKKKKNVDNASNFDTTKFYLYGIGDLLADSSFVQAYNSNIELVKKLEEEKEQFEILSQSERKKAMAKEQDNHLRLGLEEVIVVEPKVYSYKANSLDPIKSEKIEGIFSESIESAADDLGVKVYPIDRRTLSSKGTEGFNERNTLISFLTQIAQEDDINAFPADFQALKEIRQNYGTNRVMFSLVEHSRSADINWWLVAGSAFIYPTLPFTLGMYLPMKIFKSNHMEMNVIILDLEKGIAETGQSYYWNEPTYKHNLGSHMFNIFNTLKSKPL